MSAARHAGARNVVITDINPYRLDLASEIGKGTTASIRLPPERLRALVDHAHKMGYWIRFYTLNGYAPAENRGWDDNYNFGSRAAVSARLSARLRRPPRWASSWTRTRCPFVRR